MSDFRKLFPFVPPHLARLSLSLLLLMLAVGFFVHHSTGRLMSRMSSDVEQLQEAVSTTIGELFRESVLLVFLVAWVFYVDWRLAALSLVIAPVALGLSLTMGRRIRRASW